VGKFPVPHHGSGRERLMERLNIATGRGVISFKIEL